ncbi:MAG: ABC transporter ATP-binding protein [Pseudonocardiales bacterium]|nr:MAG: ABC transporter ATP-binding protein [Pseudonocardiales bacterium]
MTVAIETAAIQTTGLGRRFGGLWALRDCSVRVPAGSVAALVGPNGAGKTTLLNLLVGLLSPSEGEISVFGRRPANVPDFLASVGFVAQDCPLYRGFSATDVLHMGRSLNSRWDETAARERLAAAKVPLDRPVAKLSGGQRAQLALALAIGKQPDLLVLDEPLASLDPLARRDFLQSLMAVAARGTSVMLSSHLIGELGRACDFLIVICDGQLRLAGDIDGLLEEHQWVVGPPDAAARMPAGVHVIVSSRQDRHARLLVRTSAALLSPALQTSPVDLEDLVLVYLEQHDAPVHRLDASAVRS